MLKLKSKRTRFQIEPLEQRCLLSATPIDDLTATPTMSPAAVTYPTPVGLTPAQVRQAYGFNAISFSGQAGNGAGQTIAIIDAYNDPNIAYDLHVFDQTFGLADPSLTVVRQYINGVAPQTDAGWSGEIALDVEWAHAMAPAANILLVEANTASLGNLLASINYARSQAGVSVISMSWGSGEFWGETAYDSYFTTPAGHAPITFVASSGDNGAGATWPAISPNVLAVGGTTLGVSGSTYVNETAWSGSGGGYSSLESEPSFQAGVQTTGRRTSPDVAYDANPGSGFAVYDSVPEFGASGWFQIGGTSAGAPQWAALIAIVNQGRTAAGLSTLANADAAIYKLPSSDFHDITAGSNGYAAHSGYDLVTGRGSPIANLVVAGLVSATTTASTSTTTTTSFTRLSSSRAQRSDFINLDNATALAVAEAENLSAISSDSVASLPKAPAAASGSAAPAVLALASTSVAPSAAALPSMSHLGSVPATETGESDSAPASGLLAATSILPGVEDLRPSPQSGSVLAEPNVRSAPIPAARAVKHIFENSRLAAETWSADAEIPKTSAAGWVDSADANGDNLIPTDNTEAHYLSEDLASLIAVALVSAGSWKREQLRADRELIGRIRRSVILMRGSMP